ncbi:uncharacterized protein EAF02_001372 [Botrytis sinoallii]|uniref:uncharacterized protein n=1 Tax=Botrytis sinoallii TaxID=1463999 RepID=UPI0019021AC8|nr:uncharacterized protein EAF02_001372 [Botrytis sinoallii]KAF7891047.1 hypothetical protein EAF02_001372 [Botrytis sinoallii]
MSTEPNYVYGSGPIPPRDNRDRPSKRGDNHHPGSATQRASISSNKNPFITEDNRGIPNSKRPIDIKKIKDIDNVKNIDKIKRNAPPPPSHSDVPYPPKVAQSNEGNSRRRGGTQENPSTKERNGGHGNDATKVLRRKKAFVMK